MKYSKIEFWIATVFFAMMLYVGMLFGYGSYGHSPGEARTGMLYLINHTLPNMLLVTVTYIGFLFINFYVLPDYWFQKKYSRAVALIAIVFVITGTVFTIAESYLRAWIYDYFDDIYAANIKLFSLGFSRAFLFLGIYCAYVLIREGIRHQHQRYLTHHSIAARIIKEVALSVAIWLVILIPFYVLRLTWFFNNFGSLYIFVLPFGFSIYFLDIYWLIPRYKQAARPNILIYILSLLAIGICLGCIEIAFLLQVSGHWQLPAYIVLAWLPPFVISTGISWWVYLANEEKYKQISRLKTALGASDANLQFLRSQINPHFLFNILNTLYGTALMEHAEKTGEGIQKLGDMMRFMLHENTLDKIALSRDIEYLHNYIDLQNLRIPASGDIKIIADIADAESSLQIAPMLLIPFIENAYKHGIGFNSPSYINISLQFKDDTVLLDVHNSLHAINANDPEKGKSGIGLENVKQRLQLLYPQKHQLTIRQTNREFFAHLTLHLS